MPAVGEDLFGQLADEDVQPCSQPRIRLGSLEEKAREDERLGVRQQVIAEQMPLEPPAEPPDLNGEAREMVRLQAFARQRPFDPIHDPQANRIGLPAIARADGIFRDPSVDQPRTPGLLVRANLRAQKVKVVKIVEPEFTLAVVIPLRGGANRTGVVEENELFGADERPGLAHRASPRARAASRRRGS